MESNFGPAWGSFLATWGDYAPTGCAEDAYSAGRKDERKALSEAREAIKDLNLSDEVQTILMDIMVEARGAVMDQVAEARRQAFAETVAEANQLVKGTRSVQTRNALKSLAIWAERQTRTEK
jgi:hypothetical protein